MKHYILVKWKENYVREGLAESVKEIFEETLAIPGIHSVRVKPCCVDRANRYDLMIEMEMDREALPLYDESAPHKRWKKTYGDMLLSKAIFDSED